MAAAKAAAKKAEAEEALQMEKQHTAATECAKLEEQVRAEEHLFNLFQQQKVRIGQPLQLPLCNFRMLDLLCNTGIVLRRTRSTTSGL
jgi:hypothetical protein